MEQQREMTHKEYVQTIDKARKQINEELKKPDVDEARKKELKEQQVELQKMRNRAAEVKDKENTIYKSQQQPGKNPLTERAVVGADLANLQGMGKNVLDKGLIDMLKDCVPQEAKTMGGMSVKIETREDGHNLGMR